MHSKSRELMTTPLSLKIKCCTYNLGAQEPPPSPSSTTTATPLPTNAAGLSEWILGEETEPKADVYAIGFQEMVDLSLGNVLLTGSLSDEYANLWREAISRLLSSSSTASAAAGATTATSTTTSTKGEEKEEEEEEEDDANASYVCVCEEHLVGIVLFVFVKKSLQMLIEDVGCTTLRFGAFFGTLGNKGAVLVKMRLHSVNLCFICAHLSADRNNVTSRNECANMILSTRVSALQWKRTAIGFHIPTPLSTASSLYRNLGKQHQLEHEAIMSVADHDVVLFMGDLNYRIAHLSAEQVFAAVDAGNALDLLQDDQLTIERNGLRVFNDFQEHAIEFLPTYKWVRNADRYDRGETKLRSPAWTDRVLYKTTSSDVFPEKSLRQIYYHAAVAVPTPSDHRPVSALFDIDFPMYDHAAEEAAYAQLLGLVDKFENDLKPQGELVNRHLDFATVHAQQRDVDAQIIELSNTGSCVMAWKLSPNRLGKEELHPTWLSVFPMQGLICPGESTSIAVSVYFSAQEADAVKRDHAVSLSSSSSSSSSSSTIVLEEILVVSINNAQELYATVAVELDTN